LDHRVVCQNLTTALDQPGLTGRRGWRAGPGGGEAEPEALACVPQAPPDFDDFGVERKAVVVASAHPSAERALAFLTALPDLTAADALMRTRLNQQSADRPRL
jgi:hypothetical protein